MSLLFRSILVVKTQDVSREEIYGPILDGYIQPCSKLYDSKVLTVESIAKYLKY